jgi:hypothetical protein
LAGLADLERPVDRWNGHGSHPRQLGRAPSRRGPNPSSRAVATARPRAVATTRPHTAPTVGSAGSTAGDVAGPG